MSLSMLYFEEYGPKGAVWSEFIISVCFHDINLVRSELKCIIMQQMVKADNISGQKYLQVKGWLCSPFLLS